MNLKTYRAFTMQQALDAVKQDLGKDAVVLSTRSIRKGGFLGFGGVRGAGRALRAQPRQRAE